VYMYYKNERYINTLTLLLFCITVVLLSKLLVCSVAYSEFHLLNMDINGYCLNCTLSNKSALQTVKSALQNHDTAL